MMKERRHRLRAEAGTAVDWLPLEEVLSEHRRGIPLLLLPDGLLLDVDASMLLSSEEPVDPPPGPAGTAGKRILAKLAEVWLSQWEW
jgi:hypothetical protein